MTQTHLPPQWQYRLLAILNAHGWITADWSHESLRLLTAWAKAEGGNADWNPLNTTLKFFGSTAYNDAGVQNYLKPSYGVMATAVTLLGGNYNGIVGSLQAGTLSAEAFVAKNTLEFRTWGTDTALILAVLKETP